MSAAHLLISLDWGGTKVAGVVVDRRVSSVRRFSVPAVNLRLADPERLRDIVGQICRAAGIDSLRETWWGIGAAGGRPECDAERVLEALCGLGIDAPTEVRLWNDAQTGFAAAFGDEDGILSINGTGCILWGRCGEAEERRGGWGYLLDETPSGGYFGTLAARAILSAWEGDGETAHVARAYAREFPDRPQERAGFLADLYAGSAVQGRVASLAPLFTAAVDAESAWARYYLGLSLKNWVREVRALARSLNFPHGKPVKLIGIGGLWKNWSSFSARATRTLEQTWPGEFALGEPRFSPEWGPLVLAREELGLSVEDLAPLSGSSSAAG